MRKLFVIAAISMVSACRLSVEPVFGNGQDCSDTSTQHDSSCTPITHSPTVAVISIQPTRVYADSTDALCYQFSPSPASVRMGGSYYFQNNTNSSITIVGSDQIPWVTVGPGQTSAAFNSSAAGIYAFGIQGCRGMGGTAWYGVLDVTLN
jgi:hypothetical protein